MTQDSKNGEARDIPVIAGNVRWERPTVRSFWNALADPEREALAAAGVEEVFRPGSVLCRAGDDSSQVMIIDSGWAKVSVQAAGDSREDILAVRGQGDVVGERAALTTQVRSATVTALDEVSAMVVPADRFIEFLRGHPRAADVLQRQVTERRQEDRTRLFPGGPAGAERRLAWLLFDLAQRRGGYQPASAGAFTLPMSQQELADWAGTTQDAIARLLRSWRQREIIAPSDRDDHPDTLAARETLAWLTGLRGKLGEAEELCRGVLADRCRVLGEDHPETLTTRATLAWLTGLRGRHAEAEQMYRQVFADRNRVLGAGHPDTEAIRQELAQLAAERDAAG